MTNSFVTQSKLWAGLLICSSLVPAFAAEQKNTGDLEVRIDGGLISVLAQNVPVQDVVREIAVQADLRLVQHVELDQTISLTIERQPLPDVLDLILKNDSYQLFQHVINETEADTPAAAALWVFSEGSALAPAETIFLETAIYNGTVGEKKEAIRELVSLGTPDAVQTLSVALGDDDPRVQNTAMEALSRIGGDDALSAIASAAMDADPRLRGKAANAMAMIGGYSTPEYLKLALRDGDPQVRAFVIDALGDVGNERSMQVIHEALQDPDPEVRERAEDVLEELADDAALRVLFRPD